MIAWLRGVVLSKGSDSVVLDVQGVGYEARVSLRDLDALPPVGDIATLFVHTDVREDAITLFGFSEPGERALFLRLVGVNKIGPKIAMQALSVMSGGELQQALMAGDVAALSRIPGVGKKTAQRLALELSEKIGSIDLGGAKLPRNSKSSDLEKALSGLGFARQDIDQARLALREQIQGDAPIESLVKQALAVLRS